MTDVYDKRGPLIDTTSNNGIPFKESWYAVEDNPLSESVDVQYVDPDKELRKKIDDALEETFEGQMKKLHSVFKEFCDVIANEVYIFLKKKDEEK